MSGNPTHNALLHPLSEREAVVLGHLSEGLSNSEIAERLFLAPSTVKWYVRQLNSKLDASNREEIVARARALGLLDAPATTSAPKHNLPHQTTPFVGRDAELEELHALLMRPDISLLTILAPGGMGKTRIALEAAEQQQGRFEHGIYFVPLQPVSVPEQVVPAIAAQVGFHFQNDDRTPQAQLLDYFANKHMLLVIDTCEHLLEAAPFFTEILQAAPGVKVLATSREKLNLSNETVYTLHGMRFSSWRTPEDALTYDAVQLLEQAARRTKPDWNLTTDNMESAALICQLTAGMPLGILLAVSWLDVLSLGEIAAEIQKNVDFLETEMRDLPERHRSIRAIFEHSWRGLTDPERQVFMKLSIFRGGCTREAAEAVTCASLRTLHALVNKALLTRNTEGRYDMHELLRQYAAMKLNASGETHSLHAVHAEYFGAFVARLEPDLKNAHQLDAFRAINADIDNVLTGWQWVVEQENGDLLERYLVGMKISLSWKIGNEQLRVFLSITREQLARHSSDITKHRAFFRIAAYEGFVTASDPDAALLKILQDGIELGRETGDRKLEAMCLQALAWLNYVLGDLTPGRQMIEEARAIYRTISATFELGFAACFAAMLVPANDLTRLYDVCSEAVALLRQAGVVVELGTALNNMGAYHVVAGNFEEAEMDFHESIVIHDKVGFRQASIDPLFGLSHICCMRGDHDKAIQLAEDAMARAQEVNSPIVMIDMLLDYWRIAASCGEDATLAQLMPQIELYVARSNKPLARIAGGCYAGATAYLHGDIHAATRHLTETLSLALQREHDDVLYSILFWCSFLVAEHGDYQRATELAGCAFRSWIDQQWTHLVPAGVKLRDKLKAELGSPAYEAAWERGETLDVRATSQALLDDLSKY